MTTDLIVHFHHYNGQEHNHFPHQWKISNVDSWLIDDAGCLLIKGEEDHLLALFSSGSWDYVSNPGTTKYINPNQTELGNPVEPFSPEESPLPETISMDLNS